MNKVVKINNEHLSIKKCLRNKISNNLGKVICFASFNCHQPF
jgi:hypothetical protein